MSAFQLPVTGLILSIVLASDRIPTVVVSSIYHAKSSKSGRSFVDKLTPVSFFSLPLSLSVTVGGVFLSVDGLSGYFCSDPVKGITLPSLRSEERRVGK